MSPWQNKADGKKRWISRRTSKKRFVNVGGRSFDRSGGSGRRAKRRTRFRVSGLTLLLQDDGVGFSEVSSSAQLVSVTSSGLGILGMKERARRLGADLTIESQAGKGTTICVVAPASACR
jgi:signal transduction histidine kinase